MKDFENLCKSIGKIQGIGKKTALKIAYHLCYENKILLDELIYRLSEASKHVKVCEICGSLTDEQICDLCVSEELDDSICLVESPKDILFLQECNVYNGRYFVLVKTNEYYLKQLEQMIKRFKPSELIVAFTPSVSTDALCFYIEQYFKDYDLKISKIAQGVPNGIKIQDIDQSSLSSALINRVFT